MITGQIHGVIPPMLTPFTPSGDVDIAAHGRNMLRWNSQPLTGYLVLGSNGETPYLSEAEKLSLIEATIKHASGKMVLAGTGLESTRETVRLTNEAAGLGIDAALILTPNFYGTRMTDDALVQHYRSIADAARIPILIYNMPAVTHLSISVKAVSVLSRHPNIIGMKDSSGDVPRMAQNRAAVPESWNLIVGTASAWYPSLTLGIRAGIMALANFAGRECAEVQRLHECGDAAGALRMYSKLVPVNAAVTTTYGVPGLKYAASLFGYEGTVPRRPLLPLGDEARRAVDGILKAAELV